MGRAFDDVPQSTGLEPTAAVAQIQAPAYCLQRGSDSWQPKSKKHTHKSRLLPSTRRLDYCLPSVAETSGNIKDKET